VIRPSSSLATGLSGPLRVFSSFWPVVSDIRDLALIAPPLFLLPSLSVNRFSPQLHVQLTTLLYSMLSFRKAIETSFPRPFYVASPL